MNQNLLRALQALGVDQRTLAGVEDLANGWGSPTDALEIIERLAARALPVGLRPDLPEVEERWDANKSGRLHREDAGDRVVLLNGEPVKDWMWAHPKVGKVLVPEVHWQTGERQLDAEGNLRTVLLSGKVQVVS